MTVSVIFSETSGGVGESLPKNAGTISPGTTSSAMDFYISHDGTNQITSCRLYMLPYSAGVYLGTSSAQDDYDKMISWGDTSGAGSHSGGGIYLNMDASGVFPSTGYNQFRTGYGDTLGTAISLAKESVTDMVVLDGVIPAGLEAHVRLRVDVPAAEADTGTFYFDILMAYTATS